MKNVLAELNSWPERLFRGSIVKFAPGIWWLSCRLGWVGLFLRSEWRVPIVGFFATLLGLWAIDHFLGDWINTVLHLARTWFNLPTALAFYTLLWLVIWAWQARQRLVVEEFTNCAGDDFNTGTKGLATLLVVRLSQLHDLYHAVDEQRAIPTSASENEAIDATISVENISTILKDAVSSESTLTLGLVKIPVGTLLSLFGNFVQGPRIIGSLYRDGNMLILTAQCTKEKASFKWRVDSKLSVEQAGTPHSERLGKMVEELAYRVFTDMALSSSVRWRAAASFSKGLRSYRECLRTPKARRANLKDAESKFIETLTEDTKFSLAYYNLGVVHTELEHKEAAKAAFEQAIIQEPMAWAAYYARALGCYESGEYYRSILFCRRVTDLKPGEAALAQAYQLMASVQFRMAHKEGEKQHPSAFSMAIENSQKAIFHAYSALFEAEITQRDAVRSEHDKAVKLQTLLGVCLTDLARIYNHQAVLLPERKARRKLKKAERLLKRVLSLESTNATYYALYRAELARTYMLQGRYMPGRYREATRQLRLATRIAPDHVDYWADLAVAYAYTIVYDETEKTDEDYQEFLFRTILDFAAETPKKGFTRALEKVLRAYKELAGKGLDQTTSIERIEVIKMFLYLASKAEEVGSEGNVNTGQNGHTKRINNLLGLARAALVLGRLYPPYDEDEQLLEQDPAEFDALVKALTASEERFAADQGKNKEWEYGQILRILALLWYEAGEMKRGVTAQLMERKDNLEQASRYYRRAIEVLEQKHPREIKVQKLRSSLATTLLELQRHQEALQVAQEAIFLDALAYDNHEVLGDVYFERGDYEHAIEEWENAILRRDAVMLASYGPELHVKIGKAYVKLAQVHSELYLKEGKSQEAVYYMQQALKSCNNDHMQEKLEIYYSLGYFYCARGEYLEAAKYLRLSRNFGFAPLTSTFYLGYAYLRNKEYDAAIKEFCALEKSMREEQGRPQRIVERDTVGHIPAGEMSALAYWGQAFVYAERDVSLSRALELAEQAIEQVRSLLKDWAARLQFPARYADCKGWVLHKLGNTDEAIAWLELAVGQEAQAEIYLHLALAYESKLQQADDATEKRRFLTRIRSCCLHARELDTNKHFQPQVDDLLGRVASY